MAVSAPCATGPVRLQASDALVLVDVQCDFVSGALAVPDAASVLPVLNRYLREFARRWLAIFATRDWHPTSHCSFRDRGGPWPPHCIAGTPGAAFAVGLALGPDARVVSKATTIGRDAYSGFEDTDLDLDLRKLNVCRLFIGGLATDYCVRQTVLDARRLGYEVFLLEDAIRAVDVKPGDGERAIAEMQAAGAVPIRIGDLAPTEVAHG